ncbi:MAG: hypothetical protein HYU41_11675 [Candidatus Rokubacteria bacterium]|nr:hypothetical protein [Candidatus Rokubacteria bacterium]
MHKTIAALSLIAALAVASDAFAFGGGGGKKGGGGGFVAGGGGGVGGSIAAVTTPTPVSTPEPFAALAVGLGLVGARLLRRR